MVLAVLHVGACALMWKLSKMEDTSRPRPLLQLLFVHCTNRSFWRRLCEQCGCCRSRDARGVSDRHPHVAVVSSSSAESAQQLPEVTVPLKELNEQVSTTSANNKNVQEIEALEILEKQLNHNSWAAVSDGVNRVTVAVYLLGNALAFVFYMCPLFYLYIEHLFVVDYLNDI